MQRNYSIDILRILACLAVIIIHTAGSPIHHHMVDIGSIMYRQCMFMDALCRWSVPVFVMISGYFLLDPIKTINLKQLFTKNILRIVISFICWSVLYAILLNKNFFPIGSQEGHFWYLNMLIGLYLSIPILRLIAQNKVVLKYSCMVWILYRTYLFIGNYIDLPFDVDSFVFVEYFGYALLGYYIKSTILDSRITYVIYALGIFSILLTIYMGITSPNGSTIYFGYTSPNVIFTSISILLFFHRNPMNLSARLTNIVSEISACTYGIYLIHMYILIQVFFRVHRFIESPIPLTIICVGMVFVGGGFCVYVLRKIPFINKYLV